MKHWARNVESECDTAKTTPLWDVSVVIFPDFPPKEDWCSAIQLPLHCVELRILCFLVMFSCVAVLYDPAQTLWWTCRIFFSVHVLLCSSALWTCPNTVMNMQNPLFSGHVLLCSNALWTCPNTVMNMQNPLFSGHVLLCSNALWTCPNTVMNVQKSVFCNHVLSCVTVIYEPAQTLQSTCRIQCSVIMLSLV